MTSMRSNELAGRHEGVSRVKRPLKRYFLGSEKLQRK